jgi:hypothetical protein
MHMSSIYNGHVHRCAHQMRRLRKELLTRARQRGHATEAKDQANKLGVILEFDNPWHISKPEEWVFGPDPSEDNIYRCLPQVTLHGMDEGLTQKLNRGILLYALAETGLPPVSTNSLVQTLYKCTFFPFILCLHLTCIYRVYISCIHFLYTFHLYIMNVHTSCTLLHVIFEVHPY